MSHLDFDKARYDTKMRQVMTYMKFINADIDMQHKVEDFYAYRFANKTMFDDHLIANELPVKLRTEIGACTRHLHQPVCFLARASSPLCRTLK